MVQKLSLQDKRRHQLVKTLEFLFCHVNPTSYGEKQIVRGFLRCFYTIHSVEVVAVRLLLASGSVKS